MRLPPRFNANLNGLSCIVNMGLIQIKYTVSNIFDCGD